jgi:hypothetical protein
VQKKINAHKIIFGLVSSLLKTTTSMTKKVAKDSKVAGSSLYALEEKVVAYRCHHSATKVHVCKIEKGSFKGLCVSMPLNFLDDYDTSLPTWLWVKKFPFCGLALKPLWARKITFCKHVYHDWCAHMHFSMSTKCVALCGEEMHEGWWKVVGILKHGTKPIFPPHYKQG